MQLTIRFLLLLSLFAVSVASCTPQAPAPTPDMSAALTQAWGTAMANLQPTATPVPTETLVPSPTTVRTPPALPGTFVASQLNPKDTPHTYIQDSCQYLHDKWSSNNSKPGTVAMVVMFHGIIKGEVEKDNQISQAEFKKVMNDLHDMGFRHHYPAAGRLPVYQCQNPRALCFAGGGRPPYRSKFQRSFSHLLGAMGLAGR
jgi:hypothetical protein